MLRRCLAAEAKIYSMRPLQEAKFPLPYSLNFITIKFRYWMIISVSKKKFFNSILSGLKSISLRKMIAFFHSFVPVRHLAIFILFCFALIFSFPPTSKLNFFFEKGEEGAGGCSLPIKSLSTLLVVVNRFLSSPLVFMSQGARTVLSGTIEWNQYLPLTACPPSLILISWQVSAGSSGMEPRGTGKKEQLLA